MPDVIKWGDDYEKAIMRRVAEIYNVALATALSGQSAFLRKLRDVESGVIKPPAGYTDVQTKMWRQGFIRELMRKQKIVDGIMEQLNAAGVEASKILRDGMADIYMRNREETAKAIKTAAVQIANIDASFTLYNKNEIRILLDETEPPFSKIAYQHLGQNESIRRKLQNEMANAAINGESQKEIIERIRRITGQSVSQARRVAQTERTRIQSQARNDAISEAAQMGITMYKRWSTRMIRSRESHEALNGKVVKEGELFNAYLEYPGDVTHGAPPWETINCFCVMIPEVR